MPDPLPCSKADILRESSLSPRPPWHFFRNRTPDGGSRFVTLGNTGRRRGMRWLERRGGGMEKAWMLIFWLTVMGITAKIFLFCRNPVLPPCSRAATVRTQQWKQSSFETDLRKSEVSHERIPFLPLRKCGDCSTSVVLQFSDFCLPSRGGSANGY